MAYTPDQEEFLAYRDAEAVKFGNTPLPNNPNNLLKTYLSPLELKYAVFDKEEVRERAEAVFNAEEMALINQNVEAIDWENRVAPYNNPPIDYDMEVFHPGYTERVRQWDEQKEIMSSSRWFPEEAEWPEQVAPPIGLERSQQLALRGIDPRRGVQIDNLADRNMFRLKLGFSPRNRTLADVEKAGREYLGAGEYVFLDPTLPHLGVGFIPEGEDEIQVINTGGLTDDDVYNFLLQELPAGVGDAVATIYGARKFSGPYGAATGTALTQAGRILGMSGLAAVGAAGGDFLRLAVGKRIGAHDRDLMEILEEAGMIGAWAFAGTTTIDVAQRAIPKAWRLITGTDVPPEFYEKIRAAYSEAASPGSARTPGLLYGDPVSVKQIKDQMEELTDRYGVHFNETGEFPGWNPTLSGAATPDATDLELTFLRHADDPKLKELYDQIKEGNQVVIDDFLRTLREKVGPMISGVDDVTSAELSGSLGALVQRDIDNFINQNEEVINKIRAQVQGQEADAAVAGDLIRPVVDEEASGTLFPRVQNKLRQIRNAYQQPFNDDMKAALENPRYEGTATGAGQTRPATEAWLNARGGSADALLGSAEADEAVSLLMQQRLGGSNETLRRLQGLAREGNIDPATGKPGITGGRFESPDFSLAELNSMRVSLNDFAGETTNQTARKHALDLMSGIEEQMYTLVKQSASEASGIPLTSKVRLSRWMEANKWGDDLKDAWIAQKQAYELGNSQAIRSLIQNERPETVAAYLFGTSAEGTGVNTPVANLMTMLKQEGADEILSLQEGLAAFIQRKVLDAPNSSPRQIAMSFNEFTKEHEGVLKAVFGEEGYAARFNRGPNKFQERVIEELEAREFAIKRLKDRFGLAEADPRNRVTNIVESILTTGKTAQQSGRILEDIQYLSNLVKDHPELQAQIAQVTKRFLFQDIVTSRRGGGATLNIQRLDDLLNKGFGPVEITGEKLTFENFISPLLGDETAPEFIRNLEVLNSLAQREVGAESLDIGRPFVRGEFGPGSPIEGARMIMKMLIAPLSITGRRVTALSNRAADRARTFIGHMLLDEQLFNETMRYAQNRVSRQNFVRFLTAHHLVAAQDLGNELKYYDTEDKVQRTPPSQTTAEDFVGLGAAMGTPDRLLELAMGYGEQD